MSRPACLPDRSRKAQHDMGVAFALHHKAAQEDEPARLAHQFDERVHRLTHSPRADELGRKVERHRMAGVERAELMRSGKEREIEEGNRTCAMALNAKHALLALG